MQLLVISDCITLFVAFNTHLLLNLINNIIKIIFFLLIKRFLLINFINKLSIRGDLSFLALLFISITYNKY